MSNEYTHLIINDVRESRDNETGEVRIYADCSEVQPRTYTINITKQPINTINQIKSLRGNKVMFPTREGTFQGRSFVGVGEGEIITFNSPSSAPVKPSPFEKP